MTTESVEPATLHRLGHLSAGQLRRLVAEVIADMAPITSCSPCFEEPSIEALLA